MGKNEVGLQEHLCLMSAFSIAKQMGSVSRWMDYATNFSKGEDRFDQALSS